MKLAVYTDYAYHERNGEVFGDRAFTLFLAGLDERVDELTVLGRLHPDSRQARYPLGERVRFTALPYYPRLDRLQPVVRAFAGAMRRFWAILPDVDVVWLLGPNPFAVGFALLAMVRRKRVVLGVRSEMVSYVRSRHPGRRGLLGAAYVLEGMFRLLARRCPVVAVGPEIAARYSGSREVLEILVSLVSERHLVRGPGLEPGAGESLTILSVGRLEAEKNPLLLADVLAALRASDERWRMIVCGEGPLERQLARRLEDLGVRDATDLVGYVPLDGGLRELYRDSSALLHISWTEGFPQVLLEAFAAGLPVVATDVGGIRAAADGAVRLIPSGAADAAVRELETIRDAPAVRADLVERGRELVAEHTFEAELDRVARFVHGKP